MELNKRQTEIFEIVKADGPITGEQIAERLKLARATIRPDLAILTMAGYLDARPRVGYFYSGKRPAQSVADSMTGMRVRDFQSIPVVVEENISVYDAICQMFLGRRWNIIRRRSIFISYWSPFKKRLTKDKSREQ